MPKGPFRAITSREYFEFRTVHGMAGSVTLRLECGHRKRVKRSQEPKGDRARCPECAIPRRDP